MTRSNGAARTLGALAVSAAALLAFAARSPRAYAFGGVWSEQSGKLEQSGAQILFVDHPGPTVTAIIRIAYDGPAQQFAWLIPVLGTPTVAVSSSTVFARLDEATAPQYWVEVDVEGECAEQDDRAAAPDAGSDGGSLRPIDPAQLPIAVNQEGAVGPYEYVDLSVGATAGDPVQAAAEWLSANGYDLTDLDAEVLGPYLKRGYDLLAFKLEKGEGAAAIRPVMITYESERPTIPIRPAAVAARKDMPIQLWVIGPSQAVPDDYASLVLDDARIDWLSGRKYLAGTLPSGGAGPADSYVFTKPSNYDAVVSAAADEAGGQGFVTELGAPASQFRDEIWSSLDEQQFATLAGQSYQDGIDAVFAANYYYGGWDGWREAIAGATTLPADLTIEDFLSSPDQYRGLVAVDGAEFLRLLRERVIDPVADTAALLYDGPYLTRLYSTMSAAEMTLDPSFDYNADLAQVSNVHLARQRIACSPELARSDAPWRMELPQGGVVAGEGDEWPQAVSALPANLKVVMLGTQGPGDVLTDNSAEIGRQLFDLAGTAGGGTSVLRPTQNGVPIGGSQRVIAYGRTGSTRARPKPSTVPSCGVSRVGVRTGWALALSSSLAAAVSMLLRRRARRAS